MLLAGLQPPEEDRQVEQLTDRSTSRIAHPAMLAPTVSRPAIHHVGSARSSLHSGGMSEPTSTADSAETHDAGGDLSDEKMRDIVAEQTESASEHADTAGKDWDGQEQTLPEPA